MNEEGGWVSLETIAGFNRIRALTNDKNVIKEVSGRESLLTWISTHTLLMNDRSIM